jgi:Protein of unknown function (DUF3175)
MPSNRARKWSGQVTQKSDALDLEGGVFASNDPHEIAVSLKKSAEKASGESPIHFARRCRCSLSILIGPERISPPEGAGRSKPRRTRCARNLAATRNSNYSKRPGEKPPREGGGRFAKECGPPAESTQPRKPEPLRAGPDLTKKFHVKPFRPIRGRKPYKAEDSRPSSIRKIIDLLVQLPGGLRWSLVGPARWRSLPNVSFGNGPS